MSKDKPHAQRHWISMQAKEAADRANDLTPRMDDAYWVLEFEDSPVPEYLHDDILRSARDFRLEDAAKALADAAAIHRSLCSRGKKP